MARKFANFFATKLKNDIDATTSNIQLENVPRDKDNNIITAGRIVIEARNSDKREIVKYTGIDVGTTTLTGCVRGDGRTTATTHSKNAIVEVNVTGEDLADLYQAFEDFSVVNNSWLPTLGAPSVLAGGNQGNKIVEVTYPSLDVRPILSEGMYYRVNRPANTYGVKSMQFVRSNSQYAARTASVSGLGTLNNVIMIEAWIMPELYINGAAQCAIQVGDGVHNFIFRIDDGSPCIQANGSGGINKFWLGKNLLQPNKWTHVAIGMRLTDNSAVLYVNGKSFRIDRTFTSGADNTALASAPSRVYMGAFTDSANNPASATYANMKIKDLRVWNGYRTQQEVRDNMNQYPTNLANLVLWYKGEGDWTDSSGNGNTLNVFSGSAPNANVSASPHNGVEYARILSATLVGSDTKVLTETSFDGNIPTGTLNAPVYSFGSVPKDLPFSIEQLATLPHANQLRFNTAEATIISNVEVRLPFDAESQFARGVEAVTGAGAYLKITRSGWYNIVCQMHASDGTGGNNSIIWFCYSYDDGVTWQRMRQADRGLFIGMGNVYSTQHYLPAGTRVAIEAYHGSGGIRIGTSAGHGTQMMRDNISTSLSVVEMR